jgi:hypothetical protein
MKYCKSTADKQVMIHTHTEKNNNNNNNNNGQIDIHNSNKLIPFNVLNSGYNETLRKNVVGSWYEFTLNLMLQKLDRKVIIN